MGDNGQRWSTSRRALGCLNFMRAVLRISEPTFDFKVNVYFSDGKIKLYDLNPMIGHGVFKQISTVDAFIEKCTVINGTLAWDIGGNFDPYSCIDIDPEAIYVKGVDVADPLSDDAA